MYIDNNLPSIEIIEEKYDGMLYKMCNLFIYHHLLQYTQQSLNR